MRHGTQDPKNASARTPSEPEAIFIVGSSRSGTSLMRHLLERSPRIAIARENHFLGHVRESEGARFYFRRAGDPTRDETIRDIVSLIYGGDFARQSRWRELSTFWQWLVKNIPAEELEQRLLASDRTERGLFMALLRAYADHMGRPIMGEKTPAHIAHVDTLVDWFPSCRIIHMMRDPRAVFVSDLRRRRGKLRKPYSWFARVPGLLPFVVMIQTTVVWGGAAKLHPGYAQRHAAQYRLVRFEDLVRRPDETLRDVYEFLGVEMPADATDVKVVSAGFSKGERGFDAEAADRWRSQIGKAPRWVLELLLRRRMRLIGYA